MASFVSFMNFINEYILGIGVPCVLIVFGLYFGFRLKWFHIFHPIRTVKAALSGGGRSALSALSLALAGTLGVGNIVGVAAAIAGGGYGAVFWMWVSAFCAMILKYAEILLAIRHRRPDSGGRLHGSAMIYIKECFYSRKMYKIGGILSVIFATLLVINALSMGSMIQTGAVGDAFFSVFGLPRAVTSALLAAITLIVVWRGRDGVMSVTEKIVPFMSLGYVILSVAVLFLRAEEIPRAFAAIFGDAFNIRSVGGGILGFLVSDAVRLGTMRGLVSNEAGCGTSPTAHATAEARSPSVQGIWGIFEVFVDTILLCTLTALVIIVSGVSLDGDFMNITIRAYASALGAVAAKFMAVAVFFFGFATVICWSHYGAEGIRYISKSRFCERAFLIAYVCAVAFSGIIGGDIVWQIADLSIGFMTVINVLVLFLMRRQIVGESQELFCKLDK